MAERRYSLIYDFILFVSAQRQKRLVLSISNCQFMAKTCGCADSHMNGCNETRVAPLLITQRALQLKVQTKWLLLEISFDF